MEIQLFTILFWICILYYIIMILINLIPSDDSCPHCGNQGCGQSCRLTQASYKGAYLGALKGTSVALTLADTTAKTHEDVKNALVDNVVNPKQYLHINHKTKFSL